MPLWDDNMVVSFHKYWNYNTPDTIEQHLQLRGKYKVPLWLGESGENSNLWFRDAIQLVESHGISWTFWPLKKLGFNNPLEVKPNPGYVALVDYWHGRGPKPSPKAACNALMTLAREDTHFANTITCPDVVDAMLRQPHDDTAHSYKYHQVSKKGGKIAVSINNALFDTLEVPVTDAATQWKNLVLPWISLMPGHNLVVLRAEQGGYNLSRLEFKRAANYIDPL